MSTRPVSEPNPQELFTKLNEYREAISQVKGLLEKMEKGEQNPTARGSSETLKEGFKEFEKEIAANRRAVDRVKDFGSPVIKARLQKEYLSLEKSAKGLYGRVDKAEKASAIQKKVNKVLSAARENDADLPKLRGRAKELLTKHENMPVSCLEALNEMLQRTQQRKEVVEAALSKDAYKKFQSQYAKAKKDNENVKKAVGYLDKEVRDAIYNEICTKNKHKEDKEWAKKHLAQNGKIVTSIAEKFAKKSSESSSTSSSSSSSSSSSFDLFGPKVFDDQSFRSRRKDRDDDKEKEKVTKPSEDGNESEDYSFDTFARSTIAELSKRSQSSLLTVTDLDDDKEKEKVTKPSKDENESEDYSFDTFARSTMAEISKRSQPSLLTVTDLDDDKEKEKVTKPSKDGNESEDYSFDTFVRSTRAEISKRSQSSLSTGVTPASKADKTPALYRPPTPISRLPLPNIEDGRGAKAKPSKGAETQEKVDNQNVTGAAKLLQIVEGLEKLQKDEELTKDEENDWKLLRKMNSLFKQLELEDKNTIYRAIGKAAGMKENEAIAYGEGNLVDKFDLVLTLVQKMYQERSA